MADTTLKTNYKDDVLDTSKNTQRKYQMIQNDDGTVSFVDVTEYSQVGDSFGANDINTTNKAINGLNSDIITRANSNVFNLVKGETKTIQMHTSYDALLISTTTPSNTGQSGLIGFYVVHGRRSDLVPLTTQVSQASNIAIESIVNGIKITNNSTSHNAIVNIVSADYVVVS